MRTPCTRCGTFMDAASPDGLCETCRNRARQFNAQELKGPYKSLVLWFGVQLLLGIANVPLQQIPMMSGLIGLAILGTIVPLTLFSYRTSRALGSGVPALWAIAMFVPCVNAISLLVLSSKATTACRAAGIEVGLLGPKV